MTIRLEDHPSLLAHAFVTAFPAQLGSLSTPDWLLELLSSESPEVPTPEGVRQAVRDMLRVFGYKPSGRGKPASEYLVRAAAEGGLDSINLAVDLCNAVSLHTQLPISVVDADLLSAPLAIAVPTEGSSYVFNPSGQEIRLDGLPCLLDAKGPCANAVRDSQRTKTSAGTLQTLSVVWGIRDMPSHTEATTAWYRELATRAGGDVDEVLPTT
jgi:DNA/RNA-binding domain of Phe-tRNA-synthetase-like protein